MLEENFKCPEVLKVLIKKQIIVILQRPHNIQKKIKLDKPLFLLTFQDWFRSELQV